MNGEFLIASSFAASQDGLLSLPEVYGALSWLGVPGVEAADVVVIGGGVAGTNAVRMAMGRDGC